MSALTANALKQQRGAALLTAMIIVTLVSTLAAAMVWQQYRAVQVEGAERARAQSALILQGALDWARLILREDARANQNDNVDHLGEVWAVPLAEARLSTFLAFDRDNTDDGPEAFLSGTIDDAQARYNLRNLVRDDKDDPVELKALQRLCDSAGVPTDTASKLSAALRLALGKSKDKSSQGALVAPQNVDQLIWLGLTPDAVRRLRPLVTVLPVPTTLNINTAPREVLAAVFDGLDLASAERLVKARERKPFRQLQEAADLLPKNGVELAAERAGVTSNFFEVGGRLRLEDRVLEERSLVQRRGLDMVTLSRQRLSALANPA